jgi:hypothetical protein
MYRVTIPYKNLNCTSYKDLLNVIWNINQEIQKIVYQFKW